MTKRREAEAGNFVVRCAVRSPGPPSLEDVDRLSDALVDNDGVVGIWLGSHIEAAFDVEAPDIGQAYKVGKRVWETALRRAGLAACPTVAVSLKDAEYLEREVELPAMPPLVGVGEIAELLHVSRQRASVIARARDFPPPVAELAAGPVFNLHAVARFAERWDRKGGRPKKNSA